MWVVAGLPKVRETLLQNLDDDVLRKFSKAKIFYEMLRTVYNVYCKI